MAVALLVSIIIATFFYYITKLMQLDKQTSPREKYSSKEKVKKIKDETLFVCGSIIGMYFNITICTFHKK